MKSKSNSSLWITTIPSSLNFEALQHVLKSTFVKKVTNKERTLVAYDSFILLYKAKATKPHKYLPIEYDLKYEIVYEEKPEESEDLPEIIGFNFVKIESIETPIIYQLKADSKTIKQWRSYLRTKINQWQFHNMFAVEKKIGKGNFATVYLAERLEDSQQMAIKAFSKAAAYGEENGKEAIINEIQIMRKLEHQNLIKLFDVYETQNSLYMGMELLEGGSLYDLLKSKEILSSKHISIIMVCILKGLAYMHSKEIMHRDLKVENILFRQPNKLDTLVIADFGLATHVHEKVYLFCRCGTPGYVAPEVINVKDMKSHYGSVCDVYSAGLIFFLLLSGKPAFNAKSYNSVVKQNRSAAIDFTLKQLEIVPPKALDLLKKMLEKEPEKRITAQDALNHPYLKEALNQLEDSLAELDYVEEQDEQNVAKRMSQINEESAKFDLLRKHQLMNSPIQSPALHATNRLKPQDMSKIDSDFKMQMRSPVMTGRKDSIERSPPESKQGGNQPSKFKSPIQGSPQLNSTRGKVGSSSQNPLYKYALQKNQLNQQQQQTQVSETKQVKNVKNNLTQNI